ncbi:MAG: energy-coupled thiamine transporter ThiT [Oscillospiraceae bacterium]|jgi:thiamine transporter|nr:energy-coupled thiamine transporter ThiT [Oscillospiraceae bacterium]
MKFKTQELVLGAIMLGLATILSFIKFNQLPYGGSVTLLSMFPIVFYALRCGVVKGLAVSILYGFMQLFFGTESPLSWGLNLRTLIVCALLDYIVAYGVLGLAGIFRGKKNSLQVMGVASVLFLRFVSHFLSGVTIFKNFETFTIFGAKIVNPYLYSIVYNGAYMLPEIVFTCVGMYIFLKLPVSKHLLATA